MEVAITKNSGVCHQTLSSTTSWASVNGLLTTSSASPRSAEKPMACRTRRLICVSSSALSASRVGLPSVSTPPRKLTTTAAVSRLMVPRRCCTCSTLRSTS
ncbi:hypothetical protein D9M71_518870 [compost metagenome]